MYLFYALLFVSFKLFRISKLQRFSTSLTFRNLDSVLQLLQQVADNISPTTKWGVCNHRAKNDLLVQWCTSNSLHYAVSGTGLKWHSTPTRLRNSGVHFRLRNWIRQLHHHPRRNVLLHSVVFFHVIIALEEYSITSITSFRVIITFLLMTQSLNKII